MHAVTEAIGRYNDAWNAHDPGAIVSMHAPDMVFVKRKDVYSDSVSILRQVGLLD